MSSNFAVVNSKELGTRCWLPHRFIEGIRCNRVKQCTYPEKKTCKAVDAEIAYLQKRLQLTTRSTALEIQSLTEERRTNDA